MPWIPPSYRESERRLGHVVLVISILKIIGLWRHTIGLTVHSLHQLSSADTQTEPDNDNLGFFNRRTSYGLGGL